MLVQSLMQHSKARLFINYRAEDTGATASHLFNDLEREFAPGSIFLDHERIEAGAIWPDRLRREVESASIVFCLIGNRWLVAQDPDTGDRRLSIPEDWVRREIETALGKGKTVVPVLIDDALPPPIKAFNTLPSLATLMNHQCMQLRRKDWSNDFGKIHAFLVQRGFVPRTTTLPKPTSHVGVNPADLQELKSCLRLVEDVLGRLHNLKKAIVDLISGSIDHDEFERLQKLDDHRVTDAEIRELDLLCLSALNRVLPRTDPQIKNWLVHENRAYTVDFDISDFSKKQLILKVLLNRDAF